MESQSGLGIYISKRTALAVRLRRGEVVDRVAVEAAPDETDGLRALVRRLAEACAERNMLSSDASVALDSSLFMQHSVHSAFSHANQIAQTIRFDTEEVVAADIGTMAVGFDVARQQESGSELNVFTAEHAILSDVVLTLQAFGIDPISIVPDVACLARTIPLWATQPSLEVGGHLIGVLSHRNGYFLRSSEGAHVTPVRAFLVGRAKSKTALLGREAFATIAAQRGSAIDSLLVFDSGGSLDTAQLSAHLGTDVVEVDWFEQGGSVASAGTQTPDPVDLAIAYGASLFAGEKFHTLNFRNDFMPHQGKRLRLENAMKWACVSLTILLLALGGRLQAKWYAKQNGIEQVREKLEESYSVVMLGKKLPKNPTTSLGSVQRKLLNTTMGRPTAGDQSTAAKLQLILKAINNCYLIAGLEIDSVSISKAITIKGSARTNKGRLTFLSELQKVGLGRPTSNLPPTKKGRPPFSITIKTAPSGPRPR